MGKPDRQPDRPAEQFELPALPLESIDVVADFDSGFFLKVGHGVFCNIIGPVINMLTRHADTAFVMFIAAKDGSWFRLS